MVPADRTRLILLVSEGDPYLETALSLSAQCRACSAWRPIEYGRGDATGRTARPWDLIIFEGPLPDELPRTPILAIAPNG